MSGSRARELTRNLLGWSAPRILRIAVLLGILMISVWVHLQGAAAWGPALALAIAFIMLFTIPGYLLAALLFKSSELSRLQLLAFSSVLGIGMLIVPATLLLTLQSRLDYLVWISIGLNAGLVLIHLLRPGAVRRGPKLGLDDPGTPRINPLLAGAFVVGVILILFLFGATASDPAHTDAWNYISYVRQYVDWPHLQASDHRYASDSINFRVMLDGWLVLQALLSKVSGVEPISMFSVYLPPCLILVGLLAFFAFAKELLADPNAALLAALVMLLDLLASLRLGHGYEAGYRFLERIADDKIAAWFVFAPVALAVMLAYLRLGGRRYLVALGLSALALALTHPQALPFFAICFVAFALFHTLFNRKRETIIRLAAVLMLTLVLLSMPFAGKLAAARAGVTYSSYASTIETEPERAEGRSLLLLGNGLYMADPSLLEDDRLFVLAILLTPFLLWHLRDNRWAQFLFATAAVPLAIIYNPITAPLMGRLITPWLIRRITWLVPVALIVGSFLHMLVSVTERRLRLTSFFVRRPRVLLLIALLPIVGLGLVLRNDITSGIERFSVDRARTIPEDEQSVIDYLGDHLTADAVVLAERSEALHLSAHSTRANRVYKDYYLDGSVDQFYSSELVDDALLDILRRLQVEYVVMESGHALSSHLVLLGTMFSELYSNDTYRVYHVVSDLQPDQAFDAYSHLVAGEWAEAIDAYERAIQGNPNEVSSYLGLARAHQALGQDKEALTAYRSAAALSANSEEIVDLLAAETGIAPTYVLGYLIEGESYQRPLGPDIAYDFLERLDTANRGYPHTPDLIRRSALVIDGVPRGVIFQHPPAAIEYDLVMPAHAKLSLGLALAPEVWVLGKGDGATFEVLLQETSGTTNRLLSEYVDPKNLPAQRTWHEREIDLSPWAGQTVTITFATGPGPNGDDRYDWAVWGEPRIVQPIAYDFLDHLLEATIQNAETAETQVVSQTIGVETRPALIQHPPSSVTYSLVLPPQSSLRFGIGLDLTGWSEDTSDGVEYSIYISDPWQPHVLHRMFYRYVNPVNNPEDRRWIDEQINLARFGGQQVEIILETKPGRAGDASDDWGGWSRPVLVDETDPDDAEIEGDDSVGTP